VTKVVVNDDRFRIVSLGGSSRRYEVTNKTTGEVTSIAREAYEKRFGELYKSGFTSFRQRSTAHKASAQQIYDKAKTQHTSFDLGKFISLDDLEKRIIDTLKNRDRASGAWGMYLYIERGGSKFGTKVVSIDDIEQLIEFLNHLYAKYGIGDNDENDDVIGEATLVLIGDTR
jgi:hypothetical protein